jgi:hypothetical protein
MSAAATARAPGVPTIALTFDYELFFVGGTVERCLIEPVDLLLAELEAAGGKACFFVDATCLARMRAEPGAARQSDVVNDQVGRIVSQGHRVELHVHPQWLDAVWSGNGRWEFTKYRSNMLTDLEPAESLELMSSSADALLDAARAADPDYELEAFRAAGLCAEPFDAIRAGMLALGLTIDSSVAPGMSRDSDVHAFDYRDAPTDPCWRFDDDPLAPAGDGRFVELPITSRRTRLATKVRRRIHKMSHPAEYEVFGDGTWMPSDESLATRLQSSIGPVTLEATPLSIVRPIVASAGDLVTFISHPKAMSPVSLKSLRWLAESGARFALPAEVIAEFCPPGTRFDT